MTYKVRLEKKAGQFYASANQSLAKKLARCFRTLKQSPRQHPNIKALKGDLKGRYRYRVGDYRVIYRINDQTIEVIVLEIASRGDAYK